MSRGICQPPWPTTTVCTDRVVPGLAGQSGRHRPDRRVRVRTASRIVRGSRAGVGCARTPVGARPARGKVRGNPGTCAAAEVVLGGRPSPRSAQTNCLPHRPCTVCVVRERSVRTTVTSAADDGHAQPRTTATSTAGGPGACPLGLTAAESSSNSVRTTARRGPKWRMPRRSCTRISPSPKSPTHPDKIRDSRKCGTRALRGGWVGRRWASGRCRSRSAARSRPARSTGSAAAAGA